MQIFIDADACPVVGIVEKIAKAHNLPVTLLCDTNHVLSSDYSEVIIVGAGADAVDYKLISICRRGGYCCITGLWCCGNGIGKRTCGDDERFAQLFEKLVLMAQAKEGEQNGTV